MSQFASIRSFLGQITSFGIGLSFGVGVSEVENSTKSGCSKSFCTTSILVMLINPLAESKDILNSAFFAFTLNEPLCVLGEGGLVIMRSAT